MKKLFFIFISSLLLLTSCKVKRPDNVIPESKMEELLYDYHLAKIMGNNLSANSNYKKALYLDYVFKKYGTTEAEFDSSMVWYTRNTELLAKMYEKINEKFRAQQDEINHLVAVRDKKPPLSASGDSVDVWFLDRVATLSSFSLNNKLVFDIPADVNFEAKDTLEWKANIHFRQTDTSSVGIVMAMQVVYTNDSIISSVKNVLKSGVETFRLQADSLGNIRSVRGFIYVEPSKNNILVNEISLIRYRTKEKEKDELKADSLKEMKEVDHQKVNTISVDKPLKTLPKRRNPEELNHRRKFSRN
ncbi:DUF4296 domain-containing protein [uncultured Bacteroides sp.]|uniref:DUF4296 domain-containing protein n=1 Tax=uncultured Bacteroides sp. TaxID=162156 RepID=UPI002AABFC07|nr:DUF4296 domain-containing protein [uncultured Bacteroides sp.]